MANEEKEVSQEEVLNEEAQAEDTMNETEAELSLEEQVQALQSELKAQEDKYIRVHSDFENIKKRLEREKYQAIEYASEKFAKDLIPVLDSLGMAIDAAKKSDAGAEDLLKNLSEGVDLTLKQFLSMLDKHGVSEISGEGEFDPNIHEAVMRVDNEDVESGHVAQVMQKGYKYKERVLRAAMVSVAN